MASSAHIRFRIRVQFEALLLRCCLLWASGLRLPYFCVGYKMQPLAKCCVCCLLWHCVCFIFSCSPARGRKRETWKGQARASERGKSVSKPVLRLRAPILVAVNTPATRQLETASRLSRSRSQSQSQSPVPAFN